jgi:hypothetical protein
MRYAAGAIPRETGIVVVGDRKSPADFHINGCTFLALADQGRRIPAVRRAAFLRAQEHRLCVPMCDTGKVERDNCFGGIHIGAHLLASDSPHTWKHRAALSLPTE